MILIIVAVIMILLAAAGAEELGLALALLAGLFLLQRSFRKSIAELHNEIGRLRQRLAQYEPSPAEPEELAATSDVGLLEIPSPDAQLEVPARATENAPVETRAVQSQGVKSTAGQADSRLDGFAGWGGPKTRTPSTSGLWLLLPGAVLITGRMAFALYRDMSRS